MTLSRRNLLIAAPAAALAPLVLGVSPTFAADQRYMDAGKVYPFLDNFLKIPPQDRSRLKLTYFLLRDGKPFSSVRAWFVEPDGDKAPIPVTPEGQLTRLPTLAQITDRTKVLFEGTEGKYGIRICVQPTVRPAQEMNAQWLEQALAECNVVVKKSAGVFSAVSPKMVQVLFQGAGSGQALLDGGKTAPLPLVRGAPAFNPSNLRGAESLKFAKAPYRVEFADANKGGLSFG